MFDDFDSEINHMMRSFDDDRTFNPLEHPLDDIKLSGRDLGVSVAKLRHYVEVGHIICDPNDAQEQFSVIDYAWLQVIESLTELGLPAASITALGHQLNTAIPYHDCLKKLPGIGEDKLQSSQKLRNGTPVNLDDLEDMPFLKFILLYTMIGRMETLLAVTASGNYWIYHPAGPNWVTAPAWEQHPPCVVLSVNDLIAKWIDLDKDHPKLLALEVLTKDERKLLEAIRANNVKRFTMCSLEEADNYDLSESIKEKPELTMEECFKNLVVRNGYHVIECITKDDEVLGAFMPGLMGMITAGEIEIDAPDDPFSDLDLGGSFGFRSKWEA